MDTGTTVDFGRVDLAKFYERHAVDPLYLATANGIIQAKGAVAIPLPNDVPDSLEPRLLSSSPTEMR